MVNALPVQPLGGHWRPQRARRELTPHWNHGLEVVVIRAGRLCWMVDGVPEDVAPGDAFFTLPWQRHGGVQPLQPNNDLSFIILPLAAGQGRQTPPTDLRLHPTLAGGLAPAAQGEALAVLAGATRHALPAPALLTPLVERLVDAVAAGTSAVVPSLAALVLLEIAAAVRISAQEPGQDSTRRRVRSFLTTLPDRCHEPWTLATMAGHCGLARTRFAELVEEETGDPPRRLLLRLRAARLADLLSTSTRSVLDLSLDCGFSSGAHAARVLRQFHGCPPATWRRRATGG
jgi:AraC-like DNA-binding protein